MDYTAMAAELVNYMQTDYVLRPGDEVTIRIDSSSVENTELVRAQSFAVPQSGVILLAKLKKPIQAVGVPIRLFNSDVQTAYDEDLFNDEIAVVTVSLTRPSASSVFVFGEVSRPGVIPYTPSMSLTQAIASAGGPYISAKLTDVRVIRGSSDRGSAPRTIRVNVNSVLHDEAPDFLLLPGDVVYAQRKWIADVANTLHLSLWRLTPLSVPIAVPPIL
jgi:protein involved in polysaccharide export with SLBB domain